MGSRVREALRRAWLRAVSGRRWTRRLGPSFDPLAGDFAPYRGTGRRRLKVLLDATNRCNLRCVMCHFALEETRAAPRQELTAVDLDTLAREILPRARSVCLSAGTEPLMWKGFPDLLDVVRRSGVPEVEVITNGTLLGAREAELLVSSGLTRVQLSVDGATRETYERIRVGARFADFREALVHLRRARAGARLPELQFNVTLMSDNLHELCDLVRMAKEHEVGALDVRHVVLLPGLGMEQRSLRDRPAETRRVLEEARALALELGIALVRFPEPLATPDDVAASSPLEEEHAARAEPSAAEAPRLPRALPSRPACDAPWTQVNLRPDGRVVPCCFWYTEEPLGDLRTQSFEEIWEGDGARRLRAELLSGQLGPNCAACPALGIGSLRDPRALEGGARPGGRAAIARPAG